LKIRTGVCRAVRVVVALAAFLLAPPGGAGGAERARACPPGTADTALDRVNAARRSARLPAVRPHDRLQRVARIRALEMARRGRLTHDGIRAILRSSGYSRIAFGENLLAGLDDPAAVIDAWLRSEGHRRNVLGDYRDLGTACAVDPSGRWWWSLVLAR